MLYEILLKIEEKVFTVTLNAKNQENAIAKAMALVQAELITEVLQVVEL